MADFKSIPFDDKTFYLVIFDPPHLKHAGETSYLKAKYGTLGPNWKDDSVITGGIAYCNEGQPFELAVLKHGELCYDTPITDDVIGYLTSNEVYDLLDRIEQL